MGCPVTPDTPRQPALHVQGTVTLTCDGAALRITGGDNGRLRIDIADLPTLQKLREFSAALPDPDPGPDRATGPSKRALTRDATTMLDTLGLTVEVVFAGQRIAQAGRGIEADTLSKLMRLGPVDLDKSAVMKLGRKLFAD